MQTLVISTGSSHDDLKLAASLMGEFGVSLSVVSGGADTIADIAGAMAAASPDNGPDIAKALANLVPDETEAIVKSVSDQTGVNKTAVANAVKWVGGSPIGDNNFSTSPPADEKSVSGD